MSLFEKVKALLANLFVWAGAIAPWQAQLEWLVRVGAGIAALIVSVLTIRSLLRKERMDKEK